MKRTKSQNKIQTKPIVNNNNNKKEPVEKKEKEIQKSKGDCNELHLI